MADYGRFKEVPGLFSECILVHFPMKKQHRYIHRQRMNFGITKGMKQSEMLEIARACF